MRLALAILFCFVSAVFSTLWVLFWFVIAAQTAATNFNKAAWAATGVCLLGLVPLCWALVILTNG